tara:strand:+ start:976 stop:1638 length:663 start_codon:yes stop_codon:yes gene_type:complete
MGFGASILSTLKGQISDLKNITSNKLPELKKLASQGKDVFPQLEKLDKLITTTEKTLDSASKTIDVATKTAEGIETAAKIQKQVSDKSQAASALVPPVAVAASVASDLSDVLKSQVAETKAELEAGKDVMFPMVGDALDSIKKGIDDIKKTSDGAQKARGKKSLDKSQPVDNDAEVERIIEEGDIDALWDLEGDNFEEIEDVEDVYFEVEQITPVAGVRG